MSDRRSRRFASVLLVPFGMGALWLLWSVEGVRFTRSLLWTALDLGRRFERATELNLVDRSDLPLDYDHVGHIALWATATLLVGLATGRHPSPKLLMLVGAASLATEIAQPLISSVRGFSFGDVVANLAGIALGAVALLVLRWIASLRPMTGSAAT